MSKKNQFVQITSSQWKDAFKKNDRKDKTIMNCFSTLSWEICFWCRTNYYLQRRIRHVLIKKTQFHNRLKIRIFKIRVMWLRYHNSIFTLITIDDKWEVELRFNRKTRICNFEQKWSISSCYDHVLRDSITSCLDISSKISRQTTSSRRLYKLVLNWLWRLFMSFFDLLKLND